MAEHWHEQKVIRALVARWAPYDYTRQFVAVPNTTGFSFWEADLLVVSHAGYMTEVEVKVSMSDWKVDKKKAYKFSRLHASGGRTKYFFYAAPKELAARWQEVGIPDWAGVLAVSEREDSHGHKSMHTEVLRPAKARPGHRKLTIEEMAKLARLGALRIWDLMTTVDRLLREAEHARKP